MTALSVLAVLVGMAAMLTLACSLLAQLWPRAALSEPLRCAAFLVMTFAAIYVEVVLSGAVGGFSWPLLGALNVALLAALLWRDRGASTAMLRLAARTLSLPFEGLRGLGDRAFVAWLLLMAIVEGAVPKSVGDDVGYHLPSIMHMVRSGATLQIVPGHGVDLAAPTSYYLRGYEAILAFFFVAPGAHLWVVLAALSALAIVYFCFLDFSQQPRLARALTFFLSTSLMFGAPYKGDLLLGALSLFVMTVLIRHRRDFSAGAVPVLAALTLLLAIKSSTVMIVAVALLATVRFLRSAWPLTRIAAALTVSAVLGLAFYLGNLAYHENPVFPYRVALAGKTLFEGPARLDVYPTTLLGNLGGSMILPLVRGLARVTSPLAVLALPALVWLLWRSLRDSVSTDSRRTAFAFLTFGALTFITTPFSDNAGAPHSQLYSGHTIRMALPLMLLVLALAGSSVGAGSERAATLTTRFLTFLAVVNVVWYELAALLLKPDNAFASYAPLFHTFDVRILAAGFAALAGLALVAAHAPRPLYVFAAALAVAALLRPFIEVSSFAYSAAFRYLGKSSQIVASLTAVADRSKVVSVLFADGSTGPLRAVITPVLYRFQRFEVARWPEEAIGRDLVVVPSVVEESFGDFVHGRVYVIKKPARSLQKLAQAGYVSLFADELYTVLARGDRR